KSSVNMRPFAICYYFCRWFLYLYLSLLEFKFKTGWNFSWRIRLTCVFGSPSYCRSHSLYLNKVSEAVSDWSILAVHLGPPLSLLSRISERSSQCRVRFVAIFRCARVRRLLSVDITT